MRVLYQSSLISKILTKNYLSYNSSRELRFKIHMMFENLTKWRGLIEASVGAWKTQIGILEAQLDQFEAQLGQLQVCVGQPKTNRLT